MIEMMLSMLFVAFLMITIALTTISMSQTYQRGIILTQVNSAGRAVITDMQRTVSQSPINTTQLVVPSTPNAICFGNFSYVWNNGSNIASGINLIKYTGNANGLAAGQVVRLAKVSDPSENMCPTSGVTPSIVATTRATELLPTNSGSTGYGGIAIQAVSVGGSVQGITATQLSTSATQALYRVTFIIGTNDQTALNKTASNFATLPSCQPPDSSSGGGNLDYCAVNRFSFLIRVGGGE